MKIIVAQDYQELSRIAYGFIKDVVSANPSAVLGLATGSSPIGIYDLMAEDYAKGEVSYRNVSSVNLDEYVGLPATHNQSYRYFMQHNLFDRIDIAAQNTFVPVGTAKPQQECQRYDDLLESLPRDIQILGIGNNGHIAFNEPGTPHDSGTHIVKLDDSTRAANARFFANINEVPTHAITMGIKGIMAAKKILLVATGASKADAIAAALRGKITTDCPASVLQNHKNLIVVLDKAASAKISF